MKNYNLNLVVGGHQHRFGQTDLANHPFSSDSEVLFSMMGGEA